MTTLMLLSIPSPSSPYIFQLGPLQPRWYGLLLACGVLLGRWIARREFRRRGVDPDLAYPIAVWAVPFGLAGAHFGPASSVYSPTSPPSKQMTMQRPTKWADRAPSVTC